MRKYKLYNITIKSGADVCFNPTEGNTIKIDKDLVVDAEFDSFSKWWCWNHDEDGYGSAYTTDLQNVSIND